MWIVPKAHQSHFENATVSDIQSLGAATHTVIRKLDQVLERPAYNLMVHNRPLAGRPTRALPLARRDHPALTRMAGFEWGTGFYINPTPPEEAARFLKNAQV